MERLWSRAVATGGNRWQMRRTENGRNKPKPLPWVATDCLDPKMIRRRSIVQLFAKLNSTVVVEVGTASTTHLPHRLYRAAAGRSRSQPVRAAGKALL
jgi:hypothetical protein